MGLAVVVGAGAVAGVEVTTEPAVDASDAAGDGLGAVGLLHAAMAQDSPARPASNRGNAFITSMVNVVAGTTRGTPGRSSRGRTQLLPVILARVERRSHEQTKSGGRGQRRRKDLSFVDVVRLPCTVRPGRRSFRTNDSSSASTGSTW